jgi:hypothetical protein
MGTVIEIESKSTVTPGDRKKLDPLIKHYLSKPHPFTACVRDNTKRFGPEGAKRVCARLKDIGLGTTKWRKGGKKHGVAAGWMDPIEALVEDAGGNVDGLVAALVEASAVEILQEARPLLTTVPEVQIIKTGIEYPLSTGPCTFTPEDLSAAVAAQDDPGVPQPRIWIGHPDDKRIHGERSSPLPSGEPALGKVCNMRLTQDGHTIVGDLTGVPIWLANIMSSCFPSRSIEGRFGLKTPTGKHHRLVISGLALLGVSWPGVMTIEDLATLYTEEGPDVTVTAATPEQPVEITAAAERQLTAQVTVEDLRRAWYESNRADPTRHNWWLRSIYIDPNELIIDADDGGTLLRQNFSVKGDKVRFGKLKKVKVKYVNASHGGVEAEPINQERQHVAQFEPERVLTVNTKPTGNYIEIKLGGN